MSVILDTFPLWRIVTVPVPVKLTHTLTEYEGADPEAVVRAVAVAALPEHDAAVVAVAAFPVVFWFHVGIAPVRPEYATLVAVAALPEIEMPQVPDAPVPVSVGV